MRRVLGISVLAASVIMGVYLTCFLGGSIHYSQCMVNSGQAAGITQMRAKTEGLLDALIFDEEKLFYDDRSRTFYYSLVKGSAGAYDPEVELRGADADLEIAFLADEMTADQIKNNETVYFLVYSEDAYSEYYLKWTTLPMMNIECRVESPEEIADEPVPMNITVFDNQPGAAKRLVSSDGTICIRGGSTRGYDKKGYAVSLTQESVGGHLRDNDISLLGMRQDDDWVLYAAYNDQEKIRNVFSCNLWKDFCSTDNERGIDTGVEYRYLELFMNGEYWGLYALGYKVDRKQMQIGNDIAKEALYKVVTWADSSRVYTTGGNGYELKGIDSDDGDWSCLLMEYYGDLAAKPGDDERLYSKIDLDNAIDLYLFFNLIQGDDSVAGNLVKNLYILIRRGEDGRLTGLYAPWDMDISWGNIWEADAPLFTVPYGISADVNYVMESEFLDQLIRDGDEAVWDRIYEKYRQLRSSAWSEERLNAMLDQYEADIYASGAYLRDMERWPGGHYAEAADGLGTFRRYVMERLQEMDAYYDRLETVCRESVFVRRSAQYKDFENCNFIIEVNNRELLEKPDYRALFAYMGIDAAAITEEIHFVIANLSERKYEYLASLVGDGQNRECCAGTLGFTQIREGVYTVSLDGVACYDTTLFMQPEIRMAVIRDETVQEFSFIKGDETPPVSRGYRELAVYLEALAATGYHAVIEVNDTDEWGYPNDLQLFEALGLPWDSIVETADLIVWNGLDKTASALDFFGEFDSAAYVSEEGLSLFGNEDGGYGIYINAKEVFVSSAEERATAAIRILLLDLDSGELVECVSF